MCAPKCILSGGVYYSNRCHVFQMDAGAMVELYPVDDNCLNTFRNKMLY